MKKQMIALFVGIFVTLTAIAGAAMTAGAEEKKTVSFYMWGDGEIPFYSAMVSRYEEEHPDVDIVENFLPYEEYMSKMNTLVAADSLPDIFNLPEGNVFEWGEKGVLLDLKPLFDEAGVNPADLAIDPAIFYTEENIWSVAFNVATMTLYYNKELFAENGIELPSADPAAPWSWDEFVAAAKKLTKDGSGNTPDDEGFDPDSVVVYGAMMPTAWVTFLPLLHTNGTAVLNEDGTESGIGSEAGIEVIQSIADLANVYHCAPSLSMARGAFSDASTMLMNGQVGMLINGYWEISNFFSEDFDIGVAPVPAFRQAANISWGSGLCMSPAAAENEAAFDFYQYFINYSNAIDVAKEANVAPGGLPHTPGVFDGGENEQKWVSSFTQQKDGTEICAVFKGILMEESTVLGDNVRVKNFPTIMDNTVVPALDNVWLGEATAEEVLTSLDLSDMIDGYWR